MTASDWPWPAQVDDGRAAHLVAGFALPPVALFSTLGVRVDLSRVAGLSVVFVYPWTGREGLANPPGWDAIPGAHGSTPELEAARDLYRRFQECEAAVFALSGQDTMHQQELARRLRLPFAVLSDEGLAFANAMQLPMFAAGGSTYLSRATLVIEDGRLVRCFYPAHPPPSHPGEVLTWLKQNRQQAP